MDKIDKEIKKLSKKEQEIIKNILEKLDRKDFKSLAIKKLKDRDDVFRIRKGNLRILYLFENNEVTIISIQRRSENTYKKT